MTTQSIEVRMDINSQHKTDDVSKVGLHVFEAAGLGKPPYAIKYEIEKAYVACEGAQPLPAGVCQYCGKGIIYCYGIESSDGKKFEVGCDCLRRTSDKALVRAYKLLPAVRQRQRNATKKRDLRIQAEWSAIMADEKKVEILRRNGPIDCGFHKDIWLTFALRAWGYCGMSGRSFYLKSAKAILAKSVGAA